jgi:hypothetical protein
MVLRFILLREAGFTPRTESIEPGEMVTGFLIFQFPQLQPDAFARGTSKLTLKFADIMERTYVVRIEADQLNGTCHISPSR